MKTKLLSLALLVCFAVSCKDTYVKPDPSMIGYDYYPLAIGDYRVYDVTDIRFKFDVGDTTRFQLREEVTASFVDQANVLKYKIVRSTRPNAQSQWEEDSVMVVSKTATNVLLTQDNTTRVKLVFPVKEGRSWKGDAYNTHLNSNDEKENYTYAAVGEPFDFDIGKLREQSTGDIHFDSTATVVQGVPADNIVSLDNRKEVYAKGVGKVYRLFAHTIYKPCDTTICDDTDKSKLDGNERHEVLIEYGNLK